MSTLNTVFLKSGIKMKNKEDFKTGENEQEKRGKSKDKREKF